ncbi:uracil-DNA glycosylase [Terriglobus roseus]|uniref:Type-4 uracil-DNA glycosylase n=1 Tax=Terriglobus roseus TaxID=392734 RepID=A0A1H4JJP6_9BACT|nr:uracil-DNA glycosylase [Terriglobus roseus]SEB46225.1 DNA polymerase [Terriglobus roseus]
MDLSAEALRGYIDYLRDMGVYDMYRQGAPADSPELHAWLQSLAPASRPTVSAAPGAAQRSSAVAAPRPSSSPSLAQRPAPVRPASPRPGAGPEIVIAPMAASTPQRTIPPAATAPAAPAAFDDFIPETGPFAPPSMPLVSFNQLAPLPASRTVPQDKAAALQAVRDIIGDCTRCPLAYAGRHTIVFADGDPNAQLMFVGEGPGADEDESGVPFVGKAGQLLNNMIHAMGLKREEVYIANIVKCRPPKNRVPEPAEANTCSPFLLQQIDIVQPKIVVALGATAATYLLGVKQPLTALRGQWHDVRGAKCAVTYHPAFLLRDPRQKGEAWKDLQRVMVELGLKPPARA